MGEKKWVYLFEELSEVEEYVGGDWEDVRGLLGGKGANLAEMVRIGLPVPPGLIITTEACNEYLRLGNQFPDQMWEQVLYSLNKIEKASSKEFGSLQNPLLVSCRSGAKFSMPGMMDTILNIGLNDETVTALAKLTNDERFAYDSYRRLIQMFSSVVVQLPTEPYEDIITEYHKLQRVQTDAELSAQSWKEITEKFKNLFADLSSTKTKFPTDPMGQLKLAIEAVFKSWNSKRAVSYRNAANIPHDLGTAVSIVTMVFGNMGNDSATGVAMTRNGSTGEKVIEGDYLVNAQGEDVVAGIRMTKEIALLKEEMPETYSEFENICQRLENHYKEMQDVEFTIEKGKFWMLQTRDGKRTSKAAVTIAVDMVEEGLITEEEAVRRVTPEQVDFFLHPQFDRQSKSIAISEGNYLGSGLNVSPGAAVGIIVLDADLAEHWNKRDGKKVIMVRPETKPDDVHGMLASQGILTSKGGRTSHAALVARQFGIPAVVGVSDLNIDLNNRTITFKDKEIKEGEWLSIDGTTGEIFIGKVDTVIPDIKDPWLMKLLEWADQFRKLRIWTNADKPVDAKRAIEYGAEGIGLCRTEHMFFESDRIGIVQKMIMAEIPIERIEAINALLPFQRSDFEELFRVMEGRPIIIRLIDPPLHEFLPSNIELIHELTDLKIRLQHARTIRKIDEILQKVKEKEYILRRVENLQESNPMLGLRGVRLGIIFPELTTMQVRAIFEAACIVAKDNIPVRPEVMIPLTSHVNELKIQRKVLEDEAKLVMEERNISFDYKFGTMIEIPRAALTADQIAEYADFFSFGTNDLTQTTYGISRDDAESVFLINYLNKNILEYNPFSTIDKDGVGQLMKLAVKKAKDRKPDIECGICGEHGGDPKSIEIFHQMGLNYVSCSPYRVPIARLAAAHANLMSNDK